MNGRRSKQGPTDNSDALNDTFAQSYDNHVQIIYLINCTIHVLTMRDVFTAGN